MKVIKVEVNIDRNRKNEPYKMNDKIYVMIQNEPIIENLRNRKNRPYNIYKKVLLPQMLEILKSQHPLIYGTIKDNKWSWDQKCGCSMCPCSPGFVGNGKNSFSIYVTI